MGKSEYMMDNGKQQRLLHPLEAEKRAKKQRLVKQNEEERRKRKFSEALETDPESIKRKVLAMERQDKMGTLSIRQRVEKKEMKDLLTQHEKTHGVVELKARAKPEAAAASAAGEEKPQEVQMKWNPRAMMSMVPTALLRKRTASALEAQQRAEAVIAGSGMTAASLADEIAPAAPAPAPAPAAAAAPAAKRFKAAVDLVPDVDGSDDDDDDDDVAADRPGAAPLFSGGSSLLFSSRAHAGAAAAPSSAPRPLAPVVDLAPDTDDAGGDGGGDNMDDEFKRFMAGL